ncbi:MAG: VOC family protein [Desulfofustis sp.]|nr:VOC family protein [Desulfofustis sp.]
MATFKTNHLHIICEDLEKMKDFWTRGIGATLKENRSFGGAAGVVLQLDDLQINLRVPKSTENEIKPNEGALGYDHLGLEVDDIDSAYSDLAAFGCSIESGPAELNDRKILFLNGPENLILELIQFNR